MVDQKPQNAHHHGNLRLALIEAGITLLREGGPSALSLRKCAALAGVSHAAPAHHFGNVEGLRKEIARTAFALFAQSMEKAREAAQATAIDQLKGICRGYLQFAEAETALFEIIFGQGTGISNMPGGDTAEGRKAYFILRDACAPFVTPDRSDRQIEAQVWSLIHGYAWLRISGRFHDEDATATESVLQLIETLAQPA